MKEDRLSAGGMETSHTFDIVHLNDVLMYGIVKVWLLPSKANLTGGDLFKGYLWRRGDIQAQFLD